MLFQVFQIDYFSQLHILVRVSINDESNIDYFHNIHAHDAVYSLCRAHHLLVHMFRLPAFILLYAHSQVLFLVLGVGADDIFVLVDAWKQSISEVNGASHTRHNHRQSKGVC